MWQICPKCNGEGIIMGNYDTVTCKVCNGRKIISEKTGLPPTQEIQINGCVAGNAIFISHKRGRTGNK